MLFVENNIVIIIIITQSFICLEIKRKKRNNYHKMSIKFLKEKYVFSWPGAFYIRLKNKIRLRSNTAFENYYSKIIYYVWMLWMESKCKQQTCFVFYVCAWLISKLFTSLSFIPRQFIKNFNWIQYQCNWINNNKKKLKSIYT